MELNDAAEVLVIILSVFLALFLGLAIVLTILLIKVTRQIRSLTDSAKETVDHVNNLVDSAQRMVVPATVGRFFVDFVAKMVKKSKNKK
jgi:predicted PurR-regulated permease PerM